MRRLYLCSGVISPHPANPCPGYDAKPSDDKASVQEVWRMWDTSSLSLLLDPLWLRVVVPVRVLSNSQIKLFNYILYLKRFCVLGMTLSCIWQWGSSLGVLRMLSTPSLQLLPGPLWPRVVVPVKVSSNG